MKKTVIINYDNKMNNEDLIINLINVINEEKINILIVFIINKRFYDNDSTIGIVVYNITKIIKKIRQKTSDTQIIIETKFVKNYKEVLLIKDEYNKKSNKLILLGSKSDKKLSI